MQPPAPKVFGIGLNKTGTTSLKRCFDILGLHPLAPISGAVRQATEATRRILTDEDYEPALELARRFRAFEDRPWNLHEIYRHLDQRFPDGLFILTVRDPESWWRSTARWLETSTAGMREVYRQHLRVTHLEREPMLASYHAYNDAVRSYFAGCDRFLEIHFDRGEGWPELCRFLGLPQPELPFPHANRQEYNAADSRRRRRKRWRRRLERVARHSRARISTERCTVCSQPLRFRESGPSPGRRRLPAPARLAARRLQLLTLRSRLRPRESEEARLEALRRQRPGLSIDGLAAVCCYFNPLGYRSRLENYRRFAAAFARTGVPLLTVELLVGDDEPQLGSGPNLLRVHSSSVLWHKERLLNLGIQALLERGSGKIAWLDADIVFREPLLWPWLVAAELEESNLCQAFDTVVAYQPGAPPIPGLGAVRYLERTGIADPQFARAPSPRFPSGLPLGHSGYAWAARAELLRRVELYDAAVCGGGDKIIYLAALGRSDSAGPDWEQRILSTTRTPFERCAECGHEARSPAWERHALEWARRWADAVGGRVSSIPAAIDVLYHGDWKRRRYARRREILPRALFDPSRDLRRNADDCWEWASNKPELHRDLAAYLEGREEDSGSSDTEP